MEFIAKGITSNKLVDGKDTSITPFIGFMDNNFGVGYINNDEQKASLWGVMIPQKLLQSWRAMKLVEAVPVITNHTLVNAYYSAKENIISLDIKYLQSLTEQFKTTPRDIANDANISLCSFKELPNPKIKIDPIYRFQKPSGSSFEQDPSRLYNVPLDQISDLEKLRGRLVNAYPTKKEALTIIKNLEKYEMTELRNQMTEMADKIKQSSPFEPISLSLGKFKIPAEYWGNQSSIIKYKPA